jgi:tetratricopeptide (TPR) repeat protein
MAASDGNISEAKAFFEKVFEIAEQIGFANHPVTQNLRREYEMLGVLPQNPDDMEALRQAISNPLTVAISALLRVDSDQALVQTLHDHPILAEAETLFGLAGLINEALTQQQNATVARLVLFLAWLLEQYNHAHSEQIDLETHQAVIDLFDQVIPLAQQIDAGLAAMLRQQAGWACNTLGNHYADQVKDLEQAIAAYTRGLALDPANAMILRNRAGVHIDRQDRAAAQADIEAAAALEPNAPRVADLRKQVEELGGTREN